MREIEIRQWCDTCWQETETKEPAVLMWTVGAIAGETRPSLHTVETCERHGKDIEQLLALLQKTALYSPKASSAAPAAKAEPVELDRVFIGARTDCPACQKEVSKSALVQHIWTQHRFEKRIPMQPLACPDCKHRDSNGVAMSTHRKRAHGYDALTEALAGLKLR